VKVFLDANLLIYINVGSTTEMLEFWIDLLTRHDPYTDPLVLDETLWISRRKYGITYEQTLQFIDEDVLPYVTLLPIAENEYRAAAEILRKHNLKPSDALHLAAMKLNSIDTIASEDRELDKVKWAKRIWI